MLSIEKCLGQKMFTAGIYLDEGIEEQVSPFKSRLCFRSTEKSADGYAGYCVL